MKTVEFKRLLAQLSELNETQTQQLQTKLNHLTQEDILHQIESVHTGKCPHCESSHLIKWGKQSKLQRYRCKQCGKTHNAITKTPMAKVHNKSKWLAYCDNMSNTNDSLRKVAHRLNITLSKSFRWRHKLLTRAAMNQPNNLSGIVEVDETFFALSFKGQKKKLPRKAHKRGKEVTSRGTSKDQVPVLIVRNRSGMTADFKLDNTKTDTIKTPLSKCLAEDAVLCSDGAPVYKAVTSILNISHEAINLNKKIRVKGAFHIQNVNAYDSRLKLWMNRFHGVATKYLHHYLGWRRVLDQWKDRLDATSFLHIALGKLSPHQLLIGT